MCGMGSWVLGIDVILTGVGGFVSSQNILVCLSTSTLDRDGKILMSQDDARTCLLLLIDKARSYDVFSLTKSHWIGSPKNWLVQTKTEKPVCNVTDL